MFVNSAALVPRATIMEVSHSDLISFNGDCKRLVRKGVTARLQSLRRSLGESNGSGKKRESFADVLNHYERLCKELIAEEPVHEDLEKRFGGAVLQRCKKYMLKP
jgi:hypothetical protein